MGMICSDKLGTFATLTRSIGRRRYFRPIVALSIALLFLDLLWMLHGSQQAPQSTFHTNAKSERIYIASIHWNGEKLIRDHWAPAILDLVRHFGRDNIYVSVVEGGSWDDAKGALTELDLELEKLGVERNIELRNETHADVVNQVPGEDGWIDSPRGKKELRRIPYLAGLRNRAMVKLGELAERTEPRRFDKVLWLNDVIFNTQDVVDLLSTNNGDYSAACALDFSAPPLFYDTFAIRDSSGAPTISMTWPYFLSPLSRSAMNKMEPVPVQSCWNGMASFDAAPFYSTSEDHPPLRFRGLPDSLAKYHLEASECCLIHADNPLSVENGVYLNPNVRVAYNADAHNLVSPRNGKWPSTLQKVWGTWRNRWARMTGVFGRYTRKKLVQSRMKLWENEKLKHGKEVHRETGQRCIVDEMQVLVENGWNHL